MTVYWIIIYRHEIYGPIRIKPINYPRTKLITPPELERLYDTIIYNVSYLLPDLKYYK